jgi:cysteamine dioxygenase
MSQIDDIHAAARNPLSHVNVQRCIEVMKSMDISQLGLSESYVNSCSFSQCFPLCAEKDFELAVFIIPAGRTLKLHDHPKMAVVSKLLQGSVRVDSYAQDGAVTPEGEVPVSPKVTQTMTPASAPWSLSVTDRNYHEFTALSNCAIFDIIFPPYHEPERVCTYYEVHESPSGSLVLRPTTAPLDGPVNMG